MSYKAKDNAITVLNELNFDAPKTKDFVAMMKNLQVADKKTLFVLSNGNKNVYLSARNLTKVKVLTISELSTYSIVGANNIVFTEESVAAIEQTFKA